MKFDSLKVTNFRNYDKVSLKFWRVWEKGFPVGTPHLYLYCVHLSIS